MDVGTSIEVRVTPGAEPIIFESAEACIEWVESQIDAWRRFRDVYIKNSSHQPEGDSIRQMCAEQQLGWGQLKYGRFSLVNDAEDVSRVKWLEQEVNQRLAKRYLLAKEHPLVDRAFKLASIDPGAGGMVIAIASDTIRDELLNSKEDVAVLVNFARAMAYLSTTSAYDDALVRHVRVVNEVEKGLRDNESNRQEMQNEHRKELADLNENSRRNIEAFEEKSLASLAETRKRLEGIEAVTRKRLEEIEAEWVKLRETYDCMLKLSEPRKYWSEKLIEHERIFKRWRLAFFGAAVVSAAALAAATAVLIAYGAKMSSSIGAHTWILPAMLLGVPAFMALWLLRMCGRQWQDQLSRLEDARERVVMVETFLALSRDDASPNSIADPSQLGIVLSSIFRAGPGFSADDGPPAGLLDAIISRTGGKP